MTLSTVADWLRWQESLQTAEINLGLDRVRRVAQRLPLRPPSGAVFTVAGTNGKGTTAHALEAVLRASGRRTGLYTSPHLIDYNERIRINGEPVADAALIAAFRAVESARHEEALTYFEFGTLAALLCFVNAGCEAWVLEVGLGGRLDAVNLIDADFSLITTVALDHQEFLGNSLESIAAEKAGILRAGRPAFYGDRDVRAAVRERAAALGVVIQSPGQGFDLQQTGDVWQWQGRSAIVAGLPLPRDQSAETLRDLALAFAALEYFDASLINAALLAPVIAQLSVPGRFARVSGDPEWVLDVAHNPQAAQALCLKLRALPPRQPLVAVLGMFIGKDAVGFVTALDPVVSRWITCDTRGPRGQSATALAALLVSRGFAAVAAAGPDQAMQLAAAITPAKGRILVCGSFTVVGPAARRLGLY